MTIRIGFIGLGHMGLPMAINLIKAGYVVRGFDLQQEPLIELRGAGGEVAEDLSAAVRSQQIVFTMLQTSEQVAKIAHIIFPQMEAQTIFIDCSSIDITIIKNVHQQAIVNNIRCLDAPVSGGVKGAINASLTFMVGGEEKVLEDVRPIFAKMGKKIIYTGAAGSGQVAKICNNMVLGITMIGISEAFILAERLGLAAEKFFEVANNSSSQCWALSNNVPLPNILPTVPANSDYKPGFAARMMLKDLELSQNAAVMAEVETPLGKQATMLYRKFVAQERDDLDFSAIIKMLQRPLFME